MWDIRAWRGREASAGVGGGVGSSAKARGQYVKEVDPVTQVFRVQLDQFGPLAKHVG